MNKKNMLILISTAVLMLAACGPTGGDSTKYQKVKKALNGVESSLEKVVSKKENKAINYAIDFDSETYNEIDSYFVGAEDSERIEDQIDFDTPPLIQFKYLKTIYEKIGESYEFDKKYASDITGTLYIDFETGYQDKEKKEENKYTYNLNFSVLVNIDDNDLINADVGMVTVLHQGDKSYTSSRHAHMELQYDFSKNDANYKMALFDSTHESDLAYLNIDYNYEYNYAEVKNDNLSEWRKMRYESDVEMIKDAAHPTLDSYIAEGATIETDNTRWYKDGVLKTIRPSNENALNVAKALYSKFSLNATDLKTKEYYAKEYTNSNVIQSIYSEASRTFGQDLAYGLIARNGDEDEDEGASNWPHAIVGQYVGASDVEFSSKSSINYYLDVRSDERQRLLILFVDGANADDFAAYRNKLIEMGYEEGATSVSGTPYIKEAGEGGGYITIYVSPSYSTLTFHRMDDHSQVSFEEIYLSPLDNFKYPHDYSSIERISYETLYNTMNDFVHNDDVAIALAKDVDNDITKRVRIGYTALDERITGIGIYEVYTAYKEHYKNVNGREDMFYQDNPDGSQEVLIFEENEVKNNIIIFNHYHSSTNLVNKLLNPEQGGGEGGQGGGKTDNANVYLYLVNKFGEASLVNTLNCVAGKNILTDYLDDGRFTYYLDNQLLVEVTEENGYIYDGLSLYFKNALLIPGAIDYEYPYSGSNSVGIKGSKNIADKMSELISSDYNDLITYISKSVQSDAVKENFVFFGQGVLDTHEYKNLAEAVKINYEAYVDDYNNMWNRLGNTPLYYHVDINTGFEDIVIFDDNYNTSAGYFRFITIHSMDAPVTAYVINQENQGGNEGGDPSGEGGDPSGGNGEVKTVDMPYILFVDDQFSASGNISTYAGANILDAISKEFGNDVNAYYDLNKTAPITSLNGVVSEPRQIYLFKSTSGGDTQEEDKVVVSINVYKDDAFEKTDNIEFTKGEDVTTKLNELYSRDGYDVTFYVYINRVATPLDAYNSSADEGMVLKVDFVKQATNNTVEVKIFTENSMGAYQIVEATLGDDIRNYLTDYANHKFYLDAALSYEVSDKNCTVVKNMVIYAREVEEESPYTVVQVFVYQDGNQVDSKDILDVIIGDDVRSYLDSNGYVDGTRYIDQACTVELDDTNASVTKDMVIYIVLEGTSTPETPKETSVTIYMVKNGGVIGTKVYNMQIGKLATDSEYLSPYKQYAKYIDKTLTTPLEGDNAIVSENMMIYIDLDSTSGSGSGSSEEETTVYYYLVGGMNNWAEQDESYMMSVDPDDANHYIFEGVNFGDNANFKVITSDGVWYNEDGTEDGSPNFIIGEAGVYTVNFYVEVSEGGKHITVEKTSDYNPYENTTYYLVGTITGKDMWSVDKGFALSRNESVTDTYEFVIQGVNLMANDSIKIAGSDGSWYPENPDYTYKIDARGVYTIYFRPQGNSEWESGYFYVEKGR